jgi:hypothetical protein
MLLELVLGIALPPKTSTHPIIQKNNVTIPGATTPSGFLPQIDGVCSRVTHMLTGLLYPFIRQIPLPKPRIRLCFCSK